MSEKFWDVEVIIAGDPARTYTAARSLNDALEAAKTLVPNWKGDAEVTVKVKPRPIP